MYCDLQAAVQGHLFQYVVDVALHGVGGESESLGDFLVTHSLGGEGGNFTFTFCHPRCSGYFPFPLPKCLVDNMSEERFRQQGRTTGLRKDSIVTEIPGSAPLSMLDGVGQSILSRVER